MFNFLKHFRRTDPSPMLILVGQGNPGDKYAGNRHNLGFMTIDMIAEDHRFGPWKAKFQSLISEGTIMADGQPVKVLLMKPQTFYNETGRAVAQAARFYKVDVDKIVVFHDEIDLAPGRFRMKKGGGHSGNNGLRSMISHFGQEFRRARMGIGHPGDKSQVMNYVLADFSRSDIPWRDDLINACSRALGFLANGDDERFQTEVMRLAPSPKSDPKKDARQSGP